MSSIYGHYNVRATAFGLYTNPETALTLLG